MSPTDRIIIVVAVIVMVAALGLGAALTPSIQNERTDLQLTASADVMDALPPDVAMMYMGLGSFRGLFVDVLWARLEKMKQDGKFWEAAQLAEWVTKLQPRFPQVWAYHAWNLAYNVSVATHTPDERWQWVNDGIEILRDQGIPMNPESVLLYKELGWIFLHKIGQFSDDMHWHYKARLADEWHRFLGPPAEGMAPKVGLDGNIVRGEDGEPVMEYARIADMRRIAHAYEKYLNRTALGQPIRDELAALSGDAITAKHVEDLPNYRLDRFVVKVRRLREKLESSEPDAAERLAKLEELAEAQQAVMGVDPVQRLREDAPQVAAQIDSLGELGYELGEELLADVGELLLRRDSFTFALLGIDDTRQMPERVKGLAAWLSDAELAGARARLLAFVRARVLRDKYHMDPMWMLDLMEGRYFVHTSELAQVEEEGRIPAIPIDWRHPAAHGLYWASMGVKNWAGLLRPGDYDVLNTDRQVIHALQSLTHTGQVLYDPVEGTSSYRQLPDPRFIDAYDMAVYGAYDRILTAKEEAAMDVGVAPESFQSGHENFLIWATQQAYFWGEPARAQDYYRRLREKYTYFQPDREKRYSQPLEEFVMTEFYKEEQDKSLDEARSQIAGFIAVAITQGLVNGKGDVANRFLKLAQESHRRYQAEQNYETASEGRNRMGLPPFEEMVAVTFANFLGGDMRFTVLAKARAWRASPNWMKLPVYDRVRERLAALCAQTQPALSLERTFPAPEGIDAYRAAQQAAREKAQQRPDERQPRRVD